MCPRLRLRSLVRGIAFSASQYLGGLANVGEGRLGGRPRAILRCITNLRREAFDVRMAKLPQRLPHPPPVLEPRVLHEVGLPDVAADRREEVHERLQREKRR